MSETKKVQEPNQTPETDSYEAPAIEAVVTPEALEREVHYAGGVTGSTGATGPTGP